MRVVLDTNVVISGLLWYGAPRKLLEAARQHQIQLFTCPPLIDELDDVLNREKFAHRLALANVSRHTLITGYAALSTLVEPASIPPVIEDDPDDDIVLACALAAQADVIVSGDQHLLRLASFQNIAILNARDMLQILAEYRP